MSRGLGRIQSKALCALIVQPMLEAREVAALIFGVEEASALTASQYSSVRRALANLVRCGQIVDLGSFYAGPRHLYCPREEGFWILHRIYGAAGGPKALWPNGRAALFYGLELRRRRRESLEQLRRLQLYRWRHERAYAESARRLRRGEVQGRR